MVGSSSFGLLFSGRIWSDFEIRDSLFESRVKKHVEPSSALSSEDSDSEALRVDQEIKR